METVQIWTSCPHGAGRTQKLRDLFPNEKLEDLTVATLYHKLPKQSKIKVEKDPEASHIRFSFLAPGDEICLEIKNADGDSRKLSAVLLKLHRLSPEMSGRPPLCVRFT